MAQASSRVSGMTDDAIDKATDIVKDVASQAQDMVGRVSAHGREATEGMQEVAGNIKGAVDKSIKDQPMATLAAAALVGFVLGAIWKS